MPRIAYFDCFSGASGDMIMGALVDAGAPLDVMARELRKLPLRGYTLQARRVMKGPISATKISVKVTHDHHKHVHTDASRILKLIRKSALKEPVKKNATSIFTRLAQAEGKIHGISPSRVEFHEVGAVDSIVDVVGSCLALSLLGVERIHTSRLPMTTGSTLGQHGTFPVPGPATLELLKGIPVTYLDIDKELVTPTGAAILTTLGDPAPGFPEMTLDKIGYGAGDFDLGDRPNVMRVLIGEAAAPEESDWVWLLETNLDNTPGETVGYAIDQLLEDGALDVFATPITMKKSRPAVKLSVLVPESRRKAIERRIFRETRTLGIRRMLVERTKLKRRIDRVKTPFGTVAVKVASLNGEVIHVAPEYDDCRRAAQKSKLPLELISDQAVQLYRRQTGKRA